MVGLLKRGQSLGRTEQGGERAADAMVFHGQGVNKGPPPEGQQMRSAIHFSSGKGARSRLSKEGGPPSEMEMMKERFAKLLLGEDMSGGGKGVSSALALSNAITNLAASVFGEQWRLEPMSAETRWRWRREIDWLLSVTDHIVEFVPSLQASEDGGSNVEIMVTQLRKDLQMNIPALRKLDAMLVSSRVFNPSLMNQMQGPFQGFLDNFKEQNEFWYVSRDTEESERDNGRDDKWWHPKVQVPPHGLPEVSRRWLQFLKESVSQVLKAAMAINAQVLTEMEIPDAYIESLPRNGRSSLGDSIYKSITVDVFDPEQFLESMDLSTEHKVLDFKNRIEASIVIWKRKMHNNKDGKSSWGSAVSLEKREQVEERAETILHHIKQRFPGLPQSALDVSKIQYNRDVGQSILESYSRILESLAYAIMSRIEDVLYADSVAQDPSSSNNSSRRPSLSDAGAARKLDPKEEMGKLEDSLVSLSDFTGWHYLELESGKKAGKLEKSLSSQSKLKKLASTRKLSYIERVEHAGGWRSPRARH